MEQGRRDDATVAVRPGFVAALALAMGMGPLLLQSLTAMSPLVVADLGISRAQLGTLATTSFLVAAVVSGAGGGLLDRADLRRAMVALHVAGAGSVVVAALAHGYAGLVLGVAVSGAVLGMANPVTNRLIALRTPAAGRGAVMGIKQSGVQMAQAFAGVLLPVLALVLGWRGALGAATVPALLGLLLVLRHVPAGTAGSSHAPARREPRGQPRAGLPAVVWWLTGYAVLSGFAVQAGTLYLPLYGFEVLGLGSTAAGALTAVVGVVGLTARIVWGRVMEQAATPRSVLLVLAAGGGLGIGLVLLAEVLHPMLVWAGAVVFGATGVAANVVLMVVVLRVVPAEAVGRASGRLSMGLFGGFAVGPVAVGALVDATSDYRLGWSLALAAFLACAGLVLARRDWSR